MTAQTPGAYSDTEADPQPKTEEVMSPFAWLFMALIVGGLLLMTAGWMTVITTSVTIQFKRGRHLALWLSALCGTTLIILTKMGLVALALAPTKASDLASQEATHYLIGALLLTGFAIWVLGPIWRWCGFRTSTA